MLCSLSEDSVMTSGMLAPKRSEILWTVLEKEEGGSWSLEEIDALRVISPLMSKDKDHPQFLLLRGYLEEAEISEICGKVSIKHLKGMDNPKLPFQVTNLC